jgi:predicted Fe-Mo cluster-binding NifX family protein
MRIAIPTWARRVSPVFDVATQLAIVDADLSHPRHREVLPIGHASPARRVELLSKSGVEVLICGAVSQTLESMLTAAGIRVIPHICGEVSSVIESFLSNRLLSDPTFQLPGCGGASSASPAPKGHAGNERDDLR